MNDRSARILLVDDSPLTLACAEEALVDAGYSVHGVNDLSALGNLEASRFDLVLMDVMMPEADGDDVAAMLRTVRGLDAPILLLSSLADHELAARARDRELDGYISKTGGVEGLVTAVGTFLRNRGRTSCDHEHSVTANVPDRESDDETPTQLSR